VIGSDALDALDAFFFASVASPSSHVTGVQGVQMTKEDRYKEVQPSGGTPANRRSTIPPCDGAASPGNCQASLGNNN
jgi:hypothetical protein